MIYTVIVIKLRIWRATHKMNEVKWRLINLFVGLVLIFSIGCISQRSNDQQTTAELASSRNTKNVNEIRPILFTPEDLDMRSEFYYEITDELLELGTPVDDFMKATIELSPRGRDGIGAYGAAQDVLVYSVDQQAIQVFENEKERFSLSLGELRGFTPRLNNVISGCRLQEGHEYCKFLGQHGRYIIFANMIVEGNGDIVLTMEDWENFINAIQDRVIQQVELEEQAGQEE